MLTPPTAPTMGLAKTMEGVAREDTPMSALPSPKDPPLVDLGVLLELEQQVDDSATVLGFVNDFVDLWESRYDRMAQGLQASDPDIVLDALISLKAAAAMAGAIRLSSYAEELEKTVKDGDEPAANALLPTLRKCGQQTVLALQEQYLRPRAKG